MKIGQALKKIWGLVTRTLSPHSVAGSIILPIVVVTLLSGAIASVVAIDSISKSAADNAEIRLDAVATQASEQIGGLLARSLSDAAALSQDPSIKSTETTTQEKLAEMLRIKAFAGVFDDITLVDLSGNVIISTDNKYQSDWTTDPLFQGASRGIPSMADAIIQLDPHTVVVRIGLPVIDAKSQLTSVLAAQLNMQYFWQIIDRVKVGRTGYVCLIDDSGNIIAGPKKEQLYEKIAFASEDAGIPKQHQLLRYNDGNEEMCAVVAGINLQVPWSGSKWSFVGILPSAEAFAPVRDVEFLFWSVIGSLLVLFVIVGLVVGRILSGKIKTLSSGTTEIANGNLKHRLPATRPGDLGRLADSFNTMAARLEASSAELASWNVHLQKEVEAKTKELEKVMAGKVQSERLSAMGYIAASVAHELNDPITAISGYSQLVMRELEKCQPTEETSKPIKNTADYFKQIEKELQRSKNIIRKLTSFVRYSKSKEGTVDVNQVISDAFAITSHHLEMNNVQLSTQLQPDIAPIEGDAHQLQQVFLNLILNAQKSMPHGGKLSVQTRQIEEMDKHRVEVVFADTDGGMATERLKHIFEPLSSATAEGDDSELDLSVSQDIIVEHGGEIRVKSEAGIGTKFIVSLPVADSTPRVKPGNTDKHSLKRRHDDP